MERQHQLRLAVAVDRHLQGVVLEVQLERMGWPVVLIRIERRGSYWQRLAR
jgi:hypothetical protein